MATKYHLVDERGNPVMSSHYAANLRATGRQAVSQAPRDRQRMAESSLAGLRGAKKLTLVQVGPDGKDKRLETFGGG